MQRSEMDVNINEVFFLVGPHTLWSSPAVQVFLPLREMVLTTVNDKWSCMDFTSLAICLYVYNLYSFICAIIRMSGNMPV